MTRPIFYDLTEIMYGSNGKFTYYGILKVVAEIALDFTRKSRPVRFCVFSFADGQFYEVFPKIDETMPDGVDLKVPYCKQIRVRTVHSEPKLRDRAFAAIASPIARLINRKRWAETGYAHEPISLDGAVLMSAARPKLSSEIVSRVREMGWDTKLVIMLYDMIPLYNERGTHKNSRFASNFIHDNRYILAEADQILSISQFTADEISAFADAGAVPHPKSMTAVPLVHETDETNEPSQIDLPDEPYLLMVGTLLGRKNLDVVFDAMLQMKAAGKEPPLLVLAGKHRVTTQQRIETTEMDSIRDRILPLIDPNQTDLIRLYQGAMAVVLASHIEGWGLPAGEALWNGTPAIVSDIPVMHEVCGDLGLYFDPNDPAALVEHIVWLQTRPNARAALVARIRAARGTLRDWSDVADDVMAALQQ